MDEFVASRAQIVEPAETPRVRYNVVNTRTGRVVGSALNKRRARGILDKHDNAYGAYVHKIEAVPIVVAPRLVAPE